jgi:dephospho-CoA kinase
MLIVGLTGGIATGKSTVSHYISSLNIPLLDADLVKSFLISGC